MVPLVAAMELDGVVDTDRLDRAWQELQRRHAFLRSRVGAEGPLLSDDVRPLLRANIPGSSPAFAKDVAQILAAAARPRDLGMEAPAEAVLIRTGPEAYLLICVIDHLVSDGWSFGIVAREWCALYTTPRSAPVLDPSAIVASYRDPHRICTHRDLIADLVSEFQDARGVELQESFGGWAIQGIDLPLSIARDLRARAARERTTQFALGLAALGRALSIEHDAKDLIVSTHVANRSVPRSEQIVCATYNTVPIHIAPRGDDLDAWVAASKSAAVRALRRQSLPFSMARQALAEILPPGMLLRVMIDFDAHPFLAFVIPGIEIHEAFTWSRKRIAESVYAPTYATSSVPWPAAITLSFRETW
ncbi:MAG: condensation domain-containing protein, partial [Thermoanaerobaculia bacterium]